MNYYDNLKQIADKLTTDLGAGYIVKTILSTDDIPDQQGTKPTVLLLPGTDEIKDSTEDTLRIDRKFIVKYVKKTANKLKQDETDGEVIHSIVKSLHGYSVAKTYEIKLQYVTPEFLEEEKFRSYEVGFNVVFTLKL